MFTHKIIILLTTSISTTIPLSGNIISFRKFILTQTDHSYNFKKLFDDLETRCKVKQRILVLRYQNLYKCDSIEIIVAKYYQVDTVYDPDR